MLAVKFESTSLINSTSRMDSFTNQSRKMWLLAKNAVVKIPNTLYSDVASSKASSQFRESSNHNMSVSTRVLYH